METERATVHTGIGLEAQLVCIVHAEPAPQVTCFKYLKAEVLYFNTCVIALHYDEFMRFTLNSCLQKALKVNHYTFTFNCEYF